MLITLVSIRDTVTERAHTDLDETIDRHESMTERKRGPANHQ
jgi:hypothetical protein